MEISKGTKHFVKGMAVAVASGALVAIVDAKSQAGGVSDLDFKHVGNVAMMGGVIGLAGFIKNQKLDESEEGKTEQARAETSGSEELPE